MESKESKSVGISAVRNKQTVSDMSIANSFREKAIASSAAIAFTVGSVTVPFAVFAQDAKSAVTPDRPTLERPAAPANTNSLTARPTVSDELYKAYEFSRTGVSIIVVINTTNDSLAAHKQSLLAIKGAAETNKVPVRFFGFTTDTVPSHAYMIVKEMTFRKPPDETQNYAMNEILDLGSDAIALHAQAQKPRAKEAAKKSAPAASPQTPAR